MSARRVFRHPGLDAPYRGDTHAGMAPDAPYEAGRRARNAIRRGDTTTVDAFCASGVGYPYMTAPEAAKALAAFKQGAR